jgi:flagellar protein FlaG
MVMDIKQVSSPPLSPALPQARPAAPAPAPAASSAAPAAPQSKESSVDQARLAAAVKELNKSLESRNTGIEFSVDKEAHTTIVKVVDQSTKEVLRQIPTEEALEMAKALDKMQGMLIQNQA